MAKIFEPTPKDIQQWEQWVSERPDNVRPIARRVNPWTLYRMKPSGHRVTIYSIEENKDGTVTLKVNVLGQFNFVAFERQVFGIPPDDLEECELPDDDEILGSMDLDPAECFKQEGDE